MANITDDVLYSSVRDLAGRIRTKKLSPVELAEAYIERLEKLGSKFGAVVTVMKESGLQEARKADKEIRAGQYKGVLHGIPYGVKDLLATKGTPTTWGAEPYRHQMLNYDATVVRKLRRAGAVLVAKLAMVELAGGFGYGSADASFTGPGRCPWNADYWSGGSSTGPGAAVAAAMVPFAIGSETSGSIITPAAYCGVSGLRPTYGRVSRSGAMALSWTLDKLGPMCRNADDCGLVLSATAGRDPRDASSSSRSFTWPETQQADKKKFRIGIIKGATSRVQPGIKNNFDRSVDVLKKFCDVVEDVEYPDMPYGPVVSTIIDVEAATAFRDLLESGKASELRAAEDRWGGYAGAVVLAVDYVQAMRVRVKIMETLDKLYRGFDALVAPSRATVATPIDTDFQRAYGRRYSGGPIIPAGNIAGQPAISVPNGFGLNNLPTGIQFTGRVWSEARLLSIANAYQQATNWHKRRPKIS